LEGKGRQPNTIDSFRRHIAVLARNADLDNPCEVELAIARLKKTDPSTKKLTSTPVARALSVLSVKKESGADPLYSPKFPVQQFTRISVVITLTFELQSQRRAI
jgi:hypothetical protein